MLKAQLFCFVGVEILQSIGSLHCAVPLDAHGLRRERSRPFLVLVGIRIGAGIPITPLRV